MSSYFSVPALQGGVFFSRSAEVKRGGLFYHNILEEKKGRKGEEGKNS